MVIDCKLARKDIVAKIPEFFRNRPCRRVPQFHSREDRADTEPMAVYAIAESVRASDQMLAVTPARMQLCREKLYRVYFAIA